MSGFPARMVGVLAVGATLSCATTGGSGKYPPRRPGCDLQVFTTATPPLAGWDDIGVAEVGCHLDESEVACLRRLHAEACRMGGDVLYDVPRRASRPAEREMTMRAHVAHTRPEAGATSQEPVFSRDPIVPIAPVVPPAADGGSTSDTALK